MKVSLITCTYNSEKHLNHCINSVIQQDYQQIEYIIIDGNSSDSTIEIVKEYGDVIQLISEPDEGIYDALNKGIKLATGDIIGILHSDDFFSDHQVVSRIVDALNDTKSEIVYADIDFVANTNINKNLRHYSSKFFSPWMFRYGFQPAHPTFYTYRKNFEEYGFYKSDFKIAGDFELLLRFLYKHELSHKYINDTWVKMRLGGASTKGIKSNILLNKEILKACKLNNLHTSFFLIYLKYLVKWMSFIRR